MGTLTFNQLSTYIGGYAKLFGDLYGFAVFTGNVCVAMNGTAVLVTEFKPEVVPVPFVGNAVPASVIRAVGQLPKINSFSAENIGIKQTVWVDCEDGVSASFALPLSGKKLLTLSEKIRSVVEQPAFEEVGARKLAEFANGYHFGGFSFLKNTLKPVLEAVKAVHPLAPRSTLADVDVALAEGIATKSPLPVLRMTVSGAAKTTAVVLPAVIE